MLIAGKIVSRALRLLRVLDPTEAPEAEDFQTAADALNAIGRRLAANGLFAEWVAIDSPGDVLSASDNAEDALVFGLAARLRPEYGAELAPDVVATAQVALENLWRDKLAEFGSGSVGGTIRRALRILVTPGPNPDGYNLDGAIQALNTMMSRWEANGTALGWSAVSSLSDPIPAPDEALECIAYNLAIKLAPEYGVAITPEIATAAADGLAALRRDVLSANPLHLRARLPCSGRYNIRTDEYDTH